MSATIGAPGGSFAFTVPSDPVPPEACPNVNHPGDGGSGANGTVVVDSSGAAVGQIVLPRITTCVVLLGAVAGDYSFSVT